MWSDTGLATATRWRGRADLLAHVNHFHTKDAINKLSYLFRLSGQGNNIKYFKMNTKSRSKFSDDINER